MADLDIWRCLQISEDASTCPSLSADICRYLKISARYSGLSYTKHFDAFPYDSFCYCYCRLGEASCSTVSPDLDRLSTTKQNSDHEMPAALTRNTIAHLGATKFTSLTGSSLNCTLLRAKIRLYINHQDLPFSYEPPLMLLQFQLGFPSHLHTPGTTVEGNKPGLP